MYTVGSFLTTEDHIQVLTCTLPFSLVGWGVVPHLICRRYHFHEKHDTFGCENPFWADHRPWCLVHLTCPHLVGSGLSLVRRRLCLEHRIFRRGIWCGRGLFRTIQFTVTFPNYLVQYLSKHFMLWSLVQCRVLTYTCCQAVVLPVARMHDLYF